MLRAVLIDLSGTLHVENEVIPGAIEALKKLRSTNLIIKFVTNTTKESKRFLYERLTSLGFVLHQDEIHSSLGAARALIDKRKLKPMLILSPEAMEDFQGLELQSNEQPNAVVVGLAPSEFYYDKLNEAFKCLKNGAQLIAINVSKYYKRPDGLAIGAGFFVKGLEYSAQCKAEIVGKPNLAFFQSALGDVKPQDALMIGDDVVDDVKGAMDAGLRGFLVKTGKYQTGDENKIPNYPDEVLPSFCEAVDKILEELQAQK